jgi:predicted RNA binding protein YcfA (HicA-like mRNA interferase family)
MSKTRIENWKQCRDIRTVEKFAQEHGGQLVHENGSHEKIRNPQNNQSWPIVSGHGNEQSDGVAQGTFKTFLAWGWILVFILPAACAFINFAPAIVKAATP